LQLLHPRAEWPRSLRATLVEPVCARLRVSCVAVSMEESLQDCKQIKLRQGCVALCPNDSAQPRVLRKWHSSSGASKAQLTGPAPLPRQCLDFWLLHVGILHKSQKPKMLTMHQQDSEAGQKVISKPCNWLRLASGREESGWDSGFNKRLSERTETLRRQRSREPGLLNWYAVNEPQYEPHQRSRWGAEVDPWNLEQMLGLFVWQ
jgi:hypothetical protein